MFRKAASTLFLLALTLTLCVTQGPAQAGPDRRIVEVVGGKTAGPDQFPWIVRLSMGCGGTLPAPRVVLTAGHWVTRSGRNTGIVATAGAADLNSPAAVRA